MDQRRNKTPLRKSQQTKQKTIKVTLTHSKHIRT